MKYVGLVIIAGAWLILSGTALAETESAAAISDYSDGDEVTVSGTVEDFTGMHFTLRDNSGSVKVDLSKAKPIVLKDGAQVTITGDVDKGIFGTDIAARTISEDKGIGQKIGEAIDFATGQDAAGSARNIASIQALPESGLVKVSGTVDDIDGAKKFTLKDSTGHIDVTLKGEFASLRKGTPVTVVGYMDKGLLGKSINATEVDVKSTGAPANP